jgi:hypothetical protein
MITGRFEGDEGIGQQDPIMRGCRSGVSIANKINTGMPGGQREYRG